MSDDSQDQDATSLDARTVIDAFGGIRPMASQMGIAVSTVQGWKGRNHIPENRWRDVIAAAEAAGVDLAALTSQPAGEQDVVDANPEDRSDAQDTDTSEDNAQPESPWSTEAPPPSEEESRAEEAKPMAVETPPTEAGQPAEQAPAEQARAESTPDPAPVPAKQTRAGGGTAFLALLLSIVAVAGVLTRPYWAPMADPRVAEILTSVAPNLAPTPGQAPSAVAGIDLSALDAIAEQARALADRAAQMEDRVTALEAAVAALPTDTGGPVTDPVIVERLDRLDQSLEDIAAATAEDGSTTDAATIARLAAMEQALDDLRDGMSDAGPAAPVDPVALGAAPQSAVDALAGDVSALRTSLDELAALAEATGENISGLEERIDTLGAEVSEGKNTFQTALEEVKAAVAARPEFGGAEQAAMMLAAAEISRAVGVGRPYSGPLDRIAALTVSGPADDAISRSVAALQPYAASGLPTLERLIRGFHQIAADIHSQAVAPAGEGLLEQSLARLSGLVSIRSIGSGGDVPAVSQAEAALERGDLKGAVEALSGVPADGAGPLDTWMLSARARLGALDAAADLEAAALEAFAGATGGDS